MAPKGKKDQATNKKNPAAAGEDGQKTPPKVEEASFAQKVCPERIGTKAWSTTRSLLALCDLCEW